MLAFLTTFVIALGEIFFEKIFEIFYKKISYYFIKVHVGNLAKNVIFKKIEIHLQVFLLLKKNKHYNV
jgi:hypothetical protein